MATFSSFTGLFKSLKKTDIILLVVFLVFLIIPVSIPKVLAPWIDSPLGVSLLFVLTVYLFFILHPFIGITFILVAYELIRRSSLVSHAQVKVPIVDYNYSTSEIEQKKQKMQESKPSEPITLEQETVLQLGVYEDNPVYTILETDYVPVLENAPNAAPYS